MAAVASKFGGCPVHLAWPGAGRPYGLKQLDTEPNIVHFRAVCSSDRGRRKASSRRPRPSRGLGKTRRIKDTPAEANSESAPPTRGPNSKIPPTGRSPGDPPREALP